MQTGPQYAEQLWVVEEEGLGFHRPLSVFFPTEEEQAALPHRCHHQLPGALCLTGGPPRGLRALHAPAVRDSTCCWGDEPTEVPLGGHRPGNLVFCYVPSITRCSPAALQSQSYFLPVALKSNGL